MVNAKCASSQLRMSDILCSYITNVSDPPSTLLTLFSGIVKRQTLFAIETVQWNENGIAFDERQNLIRNINQMEQNHSFSELMTSIAFDNHPPITFPVHTQFTKNQYSIYIQWKNLLGFFCFQINLIFVF